MSTPVHQVSTLECSSVDTQKSSVDTWQPSVDTWQPSVDTCSMTALTDLFFWLAEMGFQAPNGYFQCSNGHKPFFRRFLVYLITTNLILKQEKWEEVKKKMREVHSRAFKSTQKPKSHYSLQTSNQKPLLAWFHWKSLLAQIYYIPKGGNLKKSEVKASLGLQRFQSTLEESLL